MPSVVEHALGERFSRLHPKVQWRFGFSAADGVCQIGTGVMEEMSHSLAVPVPVAWILGSRRIAPSRTGLDVPFEVENYAYTDPLGRETHATVRTFHFEGKTAEMDSTMVGSKTGSYVVDYLGAQPDLAVKTQLWVDDKGALRFTSGAPRFLIPFAPRLPALASARTEAREWWDDDKQHHGIEVEVKNPLLGRMFYYRGHFTAVERACADDQIPSRARTRKAVSRE
ncbi:DUF4166 domain-containing protein [Hoyosella altamirensis]|uniref:DUF4166 domain-containing protein n=1 Tax=Hoyosella altamirensis TaxID=616997 RepID=A0A839RI86_9ACTN|nr:DUF4166 domain-containing protein [Hoyosella altamirensis]MBB3035948.1 hypothetical protein [Hoyosella altamirensis]